MKHNGGYIYSSAYITAPTVFWFNLALRILMGPLNAYAWMKGHRDLFFGVASGPRVTLSLFSSVLEIL